MAACLLPIAVILTMWSVQVGHLITVVLSRVPGILQRGCGMPRDGSQPFTYQGHRDVVVSLAWSPDGQRVASASYDHTVQVWQAI